MIVTRDGQPVQIIRSTAPHRTSDGWHGSFELPPHADAGRAGAMGPSPHLNDWLGKVCSVEFDGPVILAPGVTIDPEKTKFPIKVGQAKIVAMAGDRCEWEGEADG